MLLKVVADPASVPLRVYAPAVNVYAPLAESSTLTRTPLVVAASVVATVPAESTIE